MDDNNNGTNESYQLFDNNNGTNECYQLFDNNNGTNESYQLFYYKIEKLLDEMAPYRKMTKKKLG